MGKQALPEGRRADGVPPYRPTGCEAEWRTEPTGDSARARPATGRGARRAGQASERRQAFILDRKSVV